MRRAFSTENSGSGDSNLSSGALRNTYSEDCASAVVVQRKFLLAVVDKMERCIAARRTMRPITSGLKAVDERDT